MENEILKILQTIVSSISEDIISSSEKDSVKASINKDNSISFMVFHSILLKITFQKDKKVIAIRKLDNINLDVLKSMFEDVKYKENDPYIKIYITDIDEINKLTVQLQSIYIYLYLKKPVEQIGCCSRYVECSDALKCTNPNKKLARCCQYKRNLENGKIFYGKHKNV